MKWQNIDEGKTIGASGSEGGLIIRDEEYEGGARVTLERGCKIAPFAITCGIYGSMLHTVYLSTQAQAEASYEALKERIGQLLALTDNALVQSGLEQLVNDF
jgi:hypothetical protein